MMQKEIVIKTTTLGSELVADILSDFNSLGIGIYDNKDLEDIRNSDGFWDYVDEDAYIKDNVVLVKAYFELENFENIFNDIVSRINFLKIEPPYDLGSLEIECHDFEEVDWYENWKSSYDVIKAGKLVIVPEWIDYEVQDGEIVVKMDPGKAFGSGTHESTKMILLFLQELDVTNKSVIDVGCGSGILALSAKAMGASHVEAYDIDDLAVHATLENAALNGFKLDKVDNASLLTKTSGKFDVVLANITADVLMMLSENLKDYMKEDGIVIISGVLNTREEEVKLKFKEKGYNLTDEKHMGVWTSYKFNMKDGN